MYKKMVGGAGNLGCPPLKQTSMATLGNCKKGGGVMATVEGLYAEVDQSTGCMRTADPGGGSQWTSEVYFASWQDTNKKPISSLGVWDGLAPWNLRFLFSNYTHHL